MILIYCPNQSPRLHYVLDFIFRQYFGLPYRISFDLDSVQDTEIIVDYSADFIENSAIQIPQHGLIFQKGINDEVQYPIPENLDLPIDEFDLFSALFYLLSRYEEYGTSNKDLHQRFDFRQSILYKNNMLDRPVIDIWLDQLKSKLMANGVKADSFKNQKFQVVPTMDIDSVFAYRGRSLFRNLAALLKDIVNVNGKELKKRLSVVLGKTQDPNDNFSQHLEWSGGSKIHYFIQVGKHGIYDKNISSRNPEFIQILKQLKSAGNTVGLHPSYSSFLKKEVILQEKMELEKMLGEKINSSRQHFLRFQLPQTYRELSAIGIEDEYSMGYSDTPGFRAGTANSFYWYDIEKEEQTKLLLHPFSMMDVAYKVYAGLSAERTILKSKDIINECKNLGIPFTFVFHNESLSGHRGWESWEKVFRFWCSGGEH